MKKALPVIVAVAVVFAVAMFFLKRSHPADSTPGRGAGLAGPETVFFIEFPDVVRSKARWKETEIRKIADEPEWKEFMAKWDDFAGQNARWREVNGVLDEIQRADPAGFFLALNSFEGKYPKIVGGFPYRGKKSEVETVVSRLRKKFLDAFQGAKAGEISIYEGTEIETLKDKGMTVSMAYRDDWFFIATDTDMLLKTLSRYIRKPDAPASLAGDPLWQETIKHGTPEPDMTMFIRWDAMVKAIEDTTRAAPGPKFPMNPAKVESMLYTAKMDGPLMRDHIYMRAAKLPASEPFANRSAAFTSQSTYLYGGSEIGRYFDQMKVAMAALDEAGSGLSKALAMKGLKIEDIWTTFGGEVALQSDWDTGAMALPTLFGAIEIRNKEKARLFAELLASKMGDTGKVTTSEAEGTTFWMLPGPVPAFQLTLAMNDKHLMFGLNSESVKSALKRAKAGPAVLPGRSDYQSAMKTVAAPTSSLFYIDAKTLFERLYEKAKPAAAFILLGKPELAKYFDASKLPKTETISRHLLPVVVTSGEVEGGMQMDCAGSFSLFQGLVPVFAGAAVSGLQNMGGAGVR